MLENVPEKMTDEAVTILAKQRDKITKWLYFQANAISRRDISDIGNIERKHGILIQIKSLIHLLGKAKEDIIEHPTMGELKPIEKIEDLQKGVEKFKKGIVKK